MQLTIRQYSIALTKPLLLNLGGIVQTLNSREGLLLQFDFSKDESSAKKIIMECAPLSGFSAETLADCCDFLNDETKVQGIFECLRQNKPLPDDTPISVAYAFEAAWFLKENNVDNALAENPLSKINICQLYQEGEVSRRITRVKLKVGRASLDEDVAQINTLSDQLLCTQKIRLDANQTWTMAELECLLDTISNPTRLEKIDYLEEPLIEEDRNKYSALIEKYNVAFALDESLRQLSMTDCLKIPATTWVIKPMLIGFKQTLLLIKTAQENNIDVVLSSSFESNISLDFYAQLATYFDLKTAQGLDTLSYLSRDLIRNSRLRESEVDV